MKICICAKSDSKDAELSSVFGRSPFFLVFNEKQDLLESIGNSATEAAHGAGPQAAQTVLNAGCDVLITNSLGPNAEKAITKSDIKVMKQAGTTVSEALTLFANKELSELN